MKIKKIDLIKFSKKNKKEIAIVLSIYQFDNKPEKFNIYKVLCNDRITTAINYKIEKL